MMKIANFLAALVFIVALSVVGSGPLLAKTQAKVSKPHVSTKPYQPPAPVSTKPYQPPAPRCAHGTWDPYGVRCDSAD
jgi:hypothetical protein